MDGRRLDDLREELNEENLSLTYRGIPLEELYQAHKELKDLRFKNQELRKQITIQQEAAERRNRQLDALHVVWCDGGCENGVHRFQPACSKIINRIVDIEITEAVVKTAEENTARLRRWWNNRQYKQSSKWGVFEVSLADNSSRCIKQYGYQDLDEAHAHAKRNSADAHHKRYYYEVDRACPATLSGHFCEKRFAHEGRHYNTIALDW